MNQKNKSILKRKTQEIFFGWLKTILPDEELEKINHKEMNKYAPKEQYYYDRGLRLVSFSPKWIRQKLKKKLKQGVDINAINVDTING
jgi:hypothetical protein